MSLLFSLWRILKLMVVLMLGKLLDIGFGNLIFCMVFFFLVGIFLQVFLICFVIVVLMFCVFFLLISFLFMSFFVKICLIVGCFFMVLYSIGCVVDGLFILLWLYCLYLIKLIKKFLLNCFWYFIVNLMVDRYVLGLLVLM